MISIPFANVTDYVQKRFALEDVYRAATEEIEEKLIGNDIAKSISVFSASAFSEPLLRYFLSERLLESSSSLPIEDEQIKLEIRAGKRGRNLHYLMLQGKDPQLDPFLALGQDIYQAIPEDKAVWLRLDRHQVNVDRIAAGETIPGLELVAMNASPWSGWDQGSYCTFRSLDGFSPAGMYCHQHPEDFLEMKVESPLGKLSIDPWRESKNSNTIAYYRINSSFQADDDQWILRVAGYVDQYVGIGRKKGS